MPLSKEVWKELEEFDPLIKNEDTAEYWRRAYFTEHTLRLAQLHNFYITLERLEIWRNGFPVLLSHEMLGRWMIEMEVWFARMGIMDDELRGMLAWRGLDERGIAVYQQVASRGVLSWYSLKHELLQKESLIQK